MKKSFLVIILFLLSSCHSQSIFVWTFGDIFGVCLLGIVILVLVVAFARALILDGITNLKRKFKKRS